MATPASIPAGQPAARHHRWYQHLYVQVLVAILIGVLLGHYLLTQGPKHARPHVATTIVSSVQLGQIARDLGVAGEPLERTRE